MSPVFAPAADRFWRHVERGSDDECWLWQGARHPLGYGNFRGRDGRYITAHRFAYLEVVGPVPDGCELDHLCRVPACVNPAHLEPVTHAENVRRGGVMHRLGTCRRGHDVAIHGYERKDRPGRRNCRECRREIRRGCH